MHQRQHYFSGDKTRVAICRVLMLAALTGCVVSPLRIRAKEPDVVARLGVQLADSVLKRWPNPDRITAKQWEYTNGIVLYGINRIYEKIGDRKYIDYIKSFVDQYVNADGQIQPIRDGHNLDVIQPSNLLFVLYRETKEQKYLRCLKNTAAKFPAFPKNNEGGFWHKENYPNQMWLDGIYMAEPFIVRYGAEIAGNNQGGVDQAFFFNTAAFQIKLIAKHTLQETKGLACHAWDASKKAPWASHSGTGVSPEVWSRGMGWYAMALVDTLEYLPQNHPDYLDIKMILKKVAVGLKATQDQQTGLWFQVMDKGSGKDNWNETSGSAMFVYTLKKAVRLGLIPSDYLGVAEKGWQGLKSKISYNSSGYPIVCGSAGAMGVKINYQSYINQWQEDDLPHGIAAVLMAASEMEF
ncbi:MAG TPA: glycoside hydrolase family 88 protein [Bacillota bacterium]|nr:glycoside hydrolase family 88 protein [Bacillota bacterium]